MKKYIISGLFIALAIPVFSQGIANIRTFQEDKKAIVVYDLLSIDPSKEFYVKLFASADGGKTFGPMLSKVSGDANTIVKPGMGKTAVWDVLKEWDKAKDDFVFRVDAISIGPNGSLPTVDDKSGQIQFLDISRTANNDVVIMFTILNKNPESSQFICANFLVVDDQDRLCRDFGGDASKLVNVPLNTKKVVTVTVKNINPDVKSFTQFDFNVSSMRVRLKDLAILSNSN